MKQLDLSGFAQYPDPPVSAPQPDPAGTIADATQAEALNNDFIAGQQRLLYTDPDAFYGKQGAEALAATPATLDKLQALRNGLLDTATNTSQRQKLARSLDNHLIVSRDNIARHAAQQALAWQKTTAQNRLDLLQKQVGFDYDDPESVANYAEAGRSAALDQARVAGLPTDADEATTMASNAASAIWRSGIEAALAKDDAKPAIALYDRARGSLAPADAAILDRYIQGARERETGRDYVAGLSMPADDPSSPLDVETSLANLATAHAAATAQNETDWPDSPSQRATNQHFLDVRFGQKKRDVVSAKADLDQSVANWLNQPTPDGQPQTELPPPSIWTRLGSELQKVVLAVLARNASGGSADAPPLDNRENGTSSVDVAPVRPASATAIPFPEVPLPSLGATATAVANTAKNLAPLAARVAGPSALAAGLLIPSNTQDVGFELGDGLRVSTPTGQRTSFIEKRVKPGLWGSDIGAEWQRLHVDAQIGKMANGRQGLVVNPEELAHEIGQEAAARVLARPGVGVPPQLPPPLLPWIVEIRIGISNDLGRTVIHRDVTEDEAQRYCSNYPKYKSIGGMATEKQRAAGLRNGRVYGQRAHSEFASTLKTEEIQAILKRNGVVEVRPEKALSAGIGKTFQRLGSSRVDVMELDEKRKVACIYDLKTGGASLTDDVITRYGYHTGIYLEGLKKGYKYIYIMPVHVQ